MKNIKKLFFVFAIALIALSINTIIIGVSAEAEYEYDCNDCDGHNHLDILGEDENVSNKVRKIDWCIANQKHRMYTRTMPDGTVRWECLDCRQPFPWP